MVYELTGRIYVSGDTLPITALQTKVTTGRLLLIRIEDHKEHICCLSRCVWLVWVFRVFSIVQRVPTAGRCPTILFGIVTRSLACFCRALGCCVRRLTTLAVYAFICPSQTTICLVVFLTLPPCNALHSMHTKSLKLQPSSSSSAKGHAAKHEEHARNHEDLLALLVAFNAEAMHQPHVLCPCSNLSACCDSFSSRPLSVEESKDQWQEKALASSFAACLHKLSRWPQHYENDLTSWSFQTLAFAIIWNCWKRAPLLQCSDTVCLSSIKTSKNPGTSETCTSCKSLRRLTFLDPGPRWNHRSSTYLSNTLALNIPK